MISDRDNVATALEALEAGRVLELGRVSVTVSEAVPPGHKISLGPIAAGDAVVKYGSAIGTASVDIPAGAHVHVHNVASSRGRGDLELPLDEPQPRLAEPPDESPSLHGPTRQTPGE